MKINSYEIQVIIIKHINIKVEKCHNISVYKEFSPNLKGCQKAFTVCKDFSTYSVILVEYSIKISQNEIRHREASLSQQKFRKSVIISDFTKNFAIFNIILKCAIRY
jgi:uncharacterized protein (DUF486 family)